MKKRNPLLDPILQKNEIDANKTISLAAALAALAMLALWISYLAGIFYADSMIAVNIAFPILTCLLLAPIFLRKTKYVEYKGYKYYLFGSFVSIVFLLNIVVPLYSVLAWAIIVPISTHYYSKKATLVSFLVTAILITIAIPLATLFGEMDPLIFKVTETQFATFTRSDTGTLLNPDSIPDRLYFLSHPDEYKALAGINVSRWISAFTFVLIPRILVIGIVYFVCHLLAVRTSNLLESEKRAVGDNEKIRSELDVASSIQRSVLPIKTPMNDNFRVHAIMSPSKEVGGDFYDYYFIDDNHFAIAIGDVSGKSISGAMFMMQAETLIKTLAPIHKDSDKILAEVNNMLTESNTANMYVTVWLGIYDIKKHTLSFTNAGHNSPVIVKNGKVEFLKDRHNTALGILKNRTYDVGKIKMGESDKILLYTDGVTESHNEFDELYGENRLTRLIVSNIANSPRGIITNIEDDLKKFRGNRQQFDDITMLMLEVTK